MRGRASLATLVLCAVAADAARAQQPGERYLLEVGASKTLERDDYREIHAQGGFRFVVPELGLTIRGQRALVMTDREQVRAAAERKAGSGLPTRGVEPPAPRRRLSLDEMRTRLERTLSALGRPSGEPLDAASEQAFELFRFLYCEEGIVVVQRGVEVIRCDRLWISPVDDRIVVENAELRYATPGAAADRVLVVRGPRFVKQGSRWVGRDVVLTSCTAAVPHAALAIGEVEIIEREGEFEVVAHGQTLQAGGVDFLPLPDARVFTRSQSEFPIRRASAGYSGQLGAQAEIVFGLPWNGTGGALHHWLTGRPAEEFRGEWELGFGWIQARGVPLEGALEYRAAGVYQGRTEAFFIDDQGKNLREIQANYDGSPIGDQSRGVVRTQNRVFFDGDTHLDLVAFQASDPAVLPEFFIGPYRIEEVPETSGYLHHGDGNRLLTVGTRFNLDDFSYRDDRALAARFVEELPVVTYQWLAQPVGKTPWDTPIVVDAETEIGQRRSDYDPHAPGGPSDRTLRADQLVELSTPFHIGDVSVRPYASGRGTFYDNTVAGGSEGRIALESGVQFGTRLSRTWRWLDGETQKSLRHVVAPRLTYRNRFHVDDRPGDFYQFQFDPGGPDAVFGPRRLQQLGYDSIDLLTERELVRFEVRNLLQQMVDTGQGRAPRDFVYLDLAQDVFPDKARDNQGETLGLFFYDLLLRPDVHWLPFDDFAFAVYGDNDWRRGMQTLDTELQFGKVLGCNWTIEYREDRLTEGAVGIGASTRLMDRWSVFAASQRDLNRDEWIAYAFGLTREDHDWSIAVSAAYNPFFGDTTFRIEFLPRFGGLNAPRRDRWAGADLRSQAGFSY